MASGVIAHRTHARDRTEDGRAVSARRRIAALCATNRHALTIAAFRCQASQATDEWEPITQATAELGSCRGRMSRLVRVLFAVLRLFVIAVAVQSTGVLHVAAMCSKRLPTALRITPTIATTNRARAVLQGARRAIACTEWWLSTRYRPRTLRSFSHRLQKSKRCGGTRRRPSRRVRERPCSAASDD